MKHRAEKNMKYTAVRINVGEAVPQGRFQFNLTIAPDPNRGEFWFERVAITGPGGSILPGRDWEPYPIAIVPVGPTESGVKTYRQATSWDLPPVVEHWRFRCIPINHAGQRNEIGALTADVTVPASTGLDLSQAEPQSTGLSVNMQRNGGFDRDFAGWTQSTTNGATATNPLVIATPGRQSAGKCARHGAGGDNALFSLPYPPCAAGELLTVELWAKMDAGTNGGSCTCFIFAFNDSVGNGAVSVLAETFQPTTEWSVFRFTAGSALPTGKNYFRIQINTPSHTLGSYYLDDIRVLRTVHGTQVRDADANSMRSDMWGPGLARSGGQVRIPDQGVRAGMLYPEQMVDGQRMTDFAVTQIKLAQDQLIDLQRLASNSVNASKFVPQAFITDAYIQNIATNKILAGTIAAAIVLTSPTLVISGGDKTVNVDSTYGIRVVKGSRTANFTEAYLTVNSDVGNAIYDGDQVFMGTGGANPYVASMAISAGGAGIVARRGTSISTRSWIDNTSIGGPSLQIMGSEVIDGARNLKNVTLPAHQHTSFSGDLGVAGRITTGVGFTVGGSHGLGSSGGFGQSFLDGSGNPRTMWFLGGIAYAVT